MIVKNNTAHKKSINIYWFKRDFRFIDNEPLCIAQQLNIPILFVYFFEPSVMHYPDSDVRHWRFVYQSLLHINKKLQSLNGKLFIFHNEVDIVFTSLVNKYQINTIFSHQEVGNNCTYDRDKRMQLFFNKHNIIWKQYQLNGIVRGLLDRKNWQKLWQAKMNEPTHVLSETNWNIELLTEQYYTTLQGKTLSNEITLPNNNFQQGGEDIAWKYVDSFIKSRHLHYSKHISKPSLSRKSCSRLSPYLAYGNISMKMLYQYTMQHYGTSSNKRALSNFISRLHWHCHFMQKFDDECSMEFENVNKGYNDIVKPKNEVFITAWQQGNTGVPLVDACMRCLVHTGYINFRMRAMVVSFFTFNLWQDWRELHFLAKQFLDYEPGIHYPQLQMQAGVTGTNTVRIYNPIKNGIEHDTEGEFTKKWLPILQNIPASKIHEPWKLSPQEQIDYKCIIGTDYPLPIVDIDATRKLASDLIWGYRKKETVKAAAVNILKKHTSNIQKSIKKKVKQKNQIIQTIIEFPQQIPELK